MEFQSSVFQNQITAPSIYITRDKPPELPPAFKKTLDTSQPQQTLPSTGPSVYVTRDKPPDLPLHQPKYNVQYYTHQVGLPQAVFTDVAPVPTKDVYLHPLPNQHYQNLDVVVPTPSAISPTQHYVVQPSPSPVVLSVPTTSLGVQHYVQPSPSPVALSVPTTSLGVPPDVVPHVPEEKFEPIVNLVLPQRPVPFALPDRSSTPPIQQLGVSSSAPILVESPKITKLDRASSPLIQHFKEDHQPDPRSLTPPPKKPNQAKKMPTPIVRQNHQVGSMDGEEPPSYSSSNWVIPDLSDLTRGFSICGLGNLGNTCWMNSIVQALSLTLPLTNYFLTRSFEKDLNHTSHTFAHHYSNLLENLWNGQKKDIIPIELLQELRTLVPSFATPFQQQDAHEAFTYILDLLHNCLNDSLTKSYHPQGPSDYREALIQHKRHDNSLIWDLFGGQLQSCIVCPHCTKRIEKFDHFTSLSLEIQKELETTNIYAVLQTFFAEPISEWHCPCCRKISKPTRKITISCLPYILVLHLKRFSQCPYTGETKKITNLVQVPMDFMDMKDYCSKNPSIITTKYRLYAIVNQKGSLSSGHYTSLVRRDHAWYLCNDKTVTTHNPKTLVSKDNYIFFYYRDDIKKNFGL